MLSAHALIVLYADMEDVLATAAETVHPGIQGAGRERALKSIDQAWGRQSHGERQRFAHGVAYIALGYLLLIADSMGYKTSPMLGFDPEGMKEALDLPKGVTIPALVAIGRGDEPGFPHHRHSVGRIPRFM